MGPISPPHHFPHTASIISSMMTWLPVCVVLLLAAVNIEAGWRERLGLVCEDPGSIDNGVREGDSFAWRDSVTYACDDEYTLLGSDTISCERDGEWSDDTPTCVFVGPDAVLWHTDSSHTNNRGRCGSEFPLYLGNSGVSIPAQCNPDDPDGNTCCSYYSWCSTSEHCDCRTCVDYAK